MLPIEPPQRSAREARRTFATELTKVSLGWPIPGDSHEDKPVLDVLAFLLGSGRSSRLFRELHEKRGIAHYVWAGAWSSSECGLFSIDAECDPPDAEAALKGLRDVVAEIQRKGPSPAELDKAVRSTIAGQLRSLATTRGQASSLGSSWLNVGSLDLARMYLEAIRRVTPAQVRDAAHRYLVAHTSNLVIVEPEGTAAKAKAKVTVTQREAIEITTLRNGLTLIMARNARLPLVSLRAGFLAGVLAETDSHAGLTQVTAQMLMKGTKTRSAEELGSVLEKLGGMLHVAGDAHRLMLAADVVKGDESLALEVFGDLLRHAKLPADQLALVKKRQIAAIREEQEDPMTVAMRLARRHIFAHTPFARTALGTEKSIAALSVADCKSLLKDHVTGANGVVTIIGDIDPKALKKHVEAAFGTLPIGKRHLTEHRMLPHHGKAGKWVHPMDKEQAVLVIGFRTVGLHHPDSYILSMIDEACSDMGSRLFNRIREELGLAYYVGAQSFMAYGAGAFYFYVGTDPAKIDLAEKEMLGQIADLAKHGLKADELERAKTTWRSQWLRGQQGNGALADAMSWDEINGLGHTHFEKLPSIIEAITAKDIKRVAAQYFKAKEAFVVRVLPKQTK
jgi:zinc protease